MLCTAAFLCLSDRLMLLLYSVTLSLCLLLKLNDDDYYYFVTHEQLKKKSYYTVDVEVENLRDLLCDLQSIRDQWSKI